MDKCPVEVISNLTDLINWFTCLLIGPVFALLMALAVAGFVYGIIKFFLNPDNEEKRKAGKGFMLWGLISLFVMVTIWSLVGILSNTFFGETRSVLPHLPEAK